MSRKNDNTSGYSSPPCFAHELVESADGVHAVDLQQAIDVARWRTAERKRLITLRQQLTADERRQASRVIADRLEPYLNAPGSIVSFYWPIKSEPNLRVLMNTLHDRGVQLALPLVGAAASPLVFREWTPQSRMQSGVWNIPVPIDGQVVIPGIIIAPVVGYDAENYRLGNGGGYFDRTVAHFASQDHAPLVLGVGYTNAQVPTIYPQPHDIPMDVIITDAA